MLKSKETAFEKKQYNGLPNVPGIWAEGGT